MQYVVCDHNNVQRAPLIQLPAWAGTHHINYEIHGRPLTGTFKCRHSLDVATQLSTIGLLTNLTESVGKENPATQPPPPQAACGGRWEARWEART